MATQRIMGVTLLRNWGNRGRPGVGLERWRKGFSDMAKLRNATGTFFGGQWGATEGCCTGSGACARYHRRKRQVVSDHSLSHSMNLVKHLLWARPGNSDSEQDSVSPQELAP